MHGSSRAFFPRAFPRRNPPWRVYMSLRKSEGPMPQAIPEARLGWRGPLLHPSHDHQIWAAENREARY
eukprot:scaffold3311_cov411-Prasinococcus_capsulatus_cf.AAC.20